MKRRRLSLFLSAMALSPGLATAQQPLDPAPRQNAEFVQAVLVDVRFYAKDAHDPALDRRCIEGEVEKNYAQMFGLGVPLVMRPPFDKLGR
jgi:hypothetical protein